MKSAIFPGKKVWVRRIFIRDRSECQLIWVTAKKDQRLQRTSKKLASPAARKLQTQILILVIGFIISFNKIKYKRKFQMLEIIPNTGETSAYHLSPCFHHWNYLVCVCDQIYCNLHGCWTCWSALAEELGAAPFLAPCEFGGKPIIEAHAEKINT